MSANERQVGGTHYAGHGKKEMQHWDVVRLFKLNYFEGQATKYIFRCRLKNGKEDVEKAIHYLQKYLEVFDHYKGSAEDIRDLANQLRKAAAVEGHVPEDALAPQLVVCSYCGASTREEYKSAHEDQCGQKQYRVSQDPDDQPSRLFSG